MLGEESRPYIDDEMREGTGACRPLQQMQQARRGESGDAPESRAVEIAEKLSLGACMPLIFIGKGRYAASNTGRDPFIRKPSTAANMPSRQTTFNMSLILLFTIDRRGFRVVQSAA
jgi:hypothetical protein